MFVVVPFTGWGRRGVSGMCCKENSSVEHVKFEISECRHLNMQIYYLEEDINYRVVRKIEDI